VVLYRSKSFFIKQKNTCNQTINTFIINILPQKYLKKRAFFPFYNSSWFFYLAPNPEALVCNTSLNNPGYSSFQSAPRIYLLPNVELFKTLLQDDF